MNRSFVSLLLFVAASWVFVQLKDEKQVIRFCFVNSGASFYVLLCSNMVINWVSSPAVPVPSDAFNLNADVSGADILKSKRAEVYFDQTTYSSSSGSTSVLTKCIWF